MHRPCLGGQEVSIMRNPKMAFLMAWIAIGLISAPVYANYGGDTPAGDQPMLHLGTIEVSGQKQVLQALQAIKVALKQPESTDPKLRDEVVCRIDDDIGTHHQEFLVCASNKTLGARREATQDSFMLACESVSGTSCYAGQAFGARTPLGTAINATSDHVLRMPVNGAALKSLLAKIPDPTPAEMAAAASSATASVAAGSTTAPSAATSSGH
jgi:acyl-CoA reductase-like NAD-dependent aldehyde dehydrogenase